MPTAPGGASAREPSTSAGKSGAFASSDPTHQHVFNTGAAHEVSE